MNIRGYRVEVQPLARHLGGGFVAFAPDLKGCVADGETREDALRHLDDAIHCWLAIARKIGQPFPAPISASEPHEQGRDAARLLPE